MSRTAIGLDIGTSSVRAAEVSFGKGPASLERFGQVALPIGAVRDGEVIDTVAVAAATRQLWSQAKFSSKRVVVGVANQKVVVRQVDLPWLPTNELRASLAFQVQEYIPMPVEQAILDFHPLEEFENEAGGRMLRVLLVAAARDMVNSALEAVTKAGLRPVMVDLNPFAILRSLAASDDLGLSGGDAEALVDIGASVTNIVIHQAGVPRFVRILLMGGADVTEAVAERMGVPVDQAEAVKQSTGMPSAPGVTDGHPAERVIEHTGAALVEEVRGSLDYYLSQPGAARLSRVLVSGGGGMLGGLAARLSAATRLPVELGSAMSNLRVGKTGLSDDQLRHVAPLVNVPVGLAMGVAS
ncbi:MAG: type IV pilus assembly protein PilM [Actinomycetota bacterium]|nr:type IV pilus assembly protein PilM [Actinomycetota bacterium]